MPPCLTPFSVEKNSDVIYVIYGKQNWFGDWKWHRAHYAVTLMFCANQEYHKLCNWKRPVENEDALVQQASHSPST